jgi:hypothetical protein
MSHHPYGARATLRALTGLDFGLRARVTSQSRQRTLFSGSQNLSAQELTWELAEMVSELRVRSFAVRGQLEQVTSQANVQCGAWRYAQRAALDLAALLAQTGKRRLAETELCVRGANGALRIAELCGREVR